jgi:hypothetical protein
MNQYNKSLENRCHHHENQDFTGCTTTGVTRDNARFLMPSMAGSNRAKRDRDQDFYEPPRNPQFNTARDQ